MTNDTQGKGRVVVGIDGSDESKAALSSAVRMAPVLVVHETRK